MDFLEDTPLARVDKSGLVRVDNNADGNCLYESILDAAYFQLDTGHPLKERAGRRVGQNRPPADARAFKADIVRFIDATLEDDSVPAEFLDAYRKSRRVVDSKQWGTTDQLNVVALMYSVCIILHAEDEDSWSVVTPMPAMYASECDEYIILRNEGGNGGAHFVALVEPTVPGMTKRRIHAMASKKKRPRPVGAAKTPSRAKPARTARASAQKPPRKRPGKKPGATGGRAGTSAKKRALPSKAKTKRPTKTRAAPKTRPSSRAKAKPSKRRGAPKAK